MRHAILAAASPQDSFSVVAGPRGTNSSRCPLWSIQWECTKCRKKTISKAGKIWAANMAARPACQTLSRKTHRSMGSYETSKGKTNRLTNRALSMSAAKTRAEIRLATHNNGKLEDVPHCQSMRESTRAKAACEGLAAVSA
jgi:hypothetical protein